MADIGWLSTQIQAKKQKDRERDAAVCMKSGHVWENLDATPPSAYTAYCTRCLKAKTGTTVEWPVLQARR